MPLPVGHAGRSATYMKRVLLVEDHESDVAEIKATFEMVSGCWSGCRRTGCFDNCR